MEFHALSGMRDYLGDAAEAMQRIYRVGRRRFRAAGFREIVTPVLEDARLFDRSLGSDSDIISKEMYTVEQAEDRVIALRPENTAGVVRSVIENKLMARHNQLKLFYGGPMFRHERPQSGRLRQFHQFGVEVIGRPDPLVDAEVIQLGKQFLEDLGVGSVTLLLNSVGGSESRPAYLEKLVEALEPYEGDLCEDCQRRLRTNPFRVLDCKEPDCQTIYREVAPRILDHLDEESERHFEELQELLDAMDVEYQRDPFLVRGLDYYRRTAFEFVAGELGSQDAVLAGGRYDGLFEELGGDPTPAVGFAAGLERLMILGDQYDSRDVETRADCFVVTFGDRALRAVLPLVKRLRNETLPGAGRAVRVEIGDPESSVKSQMRRANRYGARLVLLLGDDELEAGTIAVKRMDTGDQQPVSRSPEDRLIDDLLDRLEAVDPAELETNPTG